MKDKIQRHHKLLRDILARIRDKLPPQQATQAEIFVTRYYAFVPLEELAKRDALDLYGSALAHWAFAQQRPPGTSKLRVYNPQLESDGWESSHTIVELVTDDMPFLVDSMRMELNRHGLTVHLIIHPVVAVERRQDGALVGIRDTARNHADTVEESIIHIEVDRQSGAETLHKLELDLLRVLGDVAKAVQDWPPMRKALRGVLRQLESRPPPIPEDELSEARAFLQWVDDYHFTFIGCREYTLVVEDGVDKLKSVPGTGLGILRETGDGHESSGFAQLPLKVRKLAHDKELLILTKTNTPATVHRPVNLDYVGVKRFGDDGGIIGEWRFLGLYTRAAYNRNPQEIPILRRKVEEVMHRSGLARGSHSGKALLNILETYPRDDLFQITEDQLYRITQGILQLGEQQRIRLFARRDPYARFIACLVFAPRDRYTTEIRQRMQKILQRELHGVSVEFRVHLSESMLARIEFIVRTRPDELIDFDERAIEAQLIEAATSWQDELQASLLEHFGEEKGVHLFQQVRHAFPAGYREDFSARIAVHDVERIVELHENNVLGMSLYRPLEAAPGLLRFKIFSRGEPIPLSYVLPMLENMGVEIQDERPYRIEPRDDAWVWIHDFGMNHDAEVPPETGGIRDAFQDTFAMVWRGRVENDGFNRLVLRARLSWREVSALRAYCKYLRQIGLAFSQSYMEEALAANPGIVRQLVELFRLRFDPTRRAKAASRCARLGAELQAALDAVSSLDEDRILRSFLSVIEATVRTNYYQKDAAGDSKPYLSFKFDCSRIPELPNPRPMAEIFVYSPEVEGVHLRAGAVARGGLRWSDRREDFRTEVLGLMKAQTVKNAVIVPAGAKGGFVIKRLPDRSDRAAVSETVTRCYQTFVRGLLDLTDNLHGAKIAVPEGLYRYDGDDPYLVVAADKGTAALSDVANAVAAEYGFWLDDAFASGGSAGYDHKKMGITARSAWESVKQHFRSLDVNLDTDDFTVVGIGDMSGDVFGNGMLLSPHIKLLAAFDHRHIFLDPRPDPEVSFRERERLFNTPGSCWADYQSDLISQGGGVYDRASKSIPLSDEAREALDVAATKMTPNELVRLILGAPVDLLWNGGIGTYVKSTQESHTDASDRLNDGVRIDATQLRCRVVGEGGNLGLTQEARIEYARRGGRIDADFVHNVGGVNCSDHEVNIKILLNGIVADGELTTKQRNRLLTQMTDEVADLVLRDSYWQTQAISLDERRSAALLTEHTRLMRYLEQARGLDRVLEHLPDDEKLAERRANHEGLTRPEISVLLGYAKLRLYDQLLESDLPEDTYFSAELERYFPSPLRERFRDEIQRHRLRREILCNFIANRMLNRLGCTFAFHLQEQTSANAADLARAYTIAWETFDLRRLWGEFASLDGQVPAQIQSDMMIAGGRLVARVCRWLLRKYGRNLNTSAMIERFQQDTRTLAGSLRTLVGEGERKVIQAEAEVFTKHGVPERIALQTVCLRPLYGAMDIIEVARATDLATEDVARTYFALDQELDLAWLKGKFTELPSETYWQARARLSLRADVYDEHRTLVEAILRTEHKEASAAARLETWLSQNGPGIERYRKVVTELKAQPKLDITMLSVGLKELQVLVPVICR